MQKTSLNASVVLRNLFLFPVFVYKKTVSPILGERCKYYPSCSTYFVEAVKAKGIFFGTIQGIHRLLRCNPLSAGGVDEVK